MNDLGKMIQALRKGRDFSVRKLAELSGVSHTEIKRIEEGTRQHPSPAVLRRISSALSTPYEELMAAAHYIDEPTVDSTAPAGIQDADDLTPEELAEVNNYIKYVRSRRKENTISNS